MLFKNLSFSVRSISFTAALAGLLFGFDTGIISGALLFIQKDFVLSTGMKEFIVSAVLAGAMIGSLFSGHLTDRYGRRKIMLFVSSTFVVGTLIASLGASLGSIFAGRLLIGLAIGMGSYAAPLYIAEVAPIEKRGGLVSLNQLMITIGILSSYLINLLFTHIDGSWRWMFAAGLVPALILNIGFFFLPESPRWLVKEDRMEEAEATLKKIRATSNVSSEIQEIQHSLQVKHAPFKEIFARWIQPVLFFGIALSFIQQATGINTIIYYAPSIFELAGFQDTATSILATVGIGIVNVLSTLIAIRYLDRLGRRPLVLFGLFGMCASLLGLSIAFHLNAEGEFLKLIAILCTFSYIIFFAFSLGVIVWLALSEIFPLEVRGAAMGFAVFTSWFFNMLVSATFLTLLNAIGPAATFLFYAIVCVGGFFYCYYKMPETKGVSLEQIEENIRAGLPLRKIGQPIVINPILPEEAELGLESAE